MFLDFALLTEQQGELLDQVEFQVKQAADYVEEGNVEVVEAVEYQKKIRKKQWYVCSFYMPGCDFTTWICAEANSFFLFLTPQKTSLCKVSLLSLESLHFLLYCSVQVSLNSKLLKVCRCSKIKKERKLKSSNYLTVQRKKPSKTIFIFPKSVLVY